MDRSRIVDHARTHVGKKFVHCGRAKDRGLDCMGLLLACAEDAGFRLRDTPKKPYSTVVTDTFQRYLDIFMDRVPAGEMEPGDWAFITYGTAHGTHVACFTGETIVHACAIARVVLEIPYDAVAQKNTLWGYRFRELS